MFGDYVPSTIRLMCGPASIRFITKLQNSMTVFNRWKLEQSDMSVMKSDQDDLGAFLDFLDTPHRDETQDLLAGLSPVT